MLQVKDCSCKDKDKWFLWRFMTARSYSAKTELILDSLTYDQSTDCFFILCI